MKKTILFIVAICFIAIGNAQITITEEGGAPIVNNETYYYSNLGVELPIFISNEGNDTAYILAELVNMENASGNNLQFCLGGTCYAVIAEGNTYPLNGPLTLQAGGNNGLFDHFFNNYSGDNTNAPVEYTFRFYEVDVNGNELGDIVTFTYTYDASLHSSNYSLENLGVVLNSSIITNDISFSTKENVTINVYNLNGKQIKSQNFAHGAHNLNASQLNTGVYLVKFNTLNGKQATTKIIKK